MFYKQMWNYFTVHPVHVTPQVQHWISALLNILVWRKYRSAIRLCC